MQTQQRKIPIRGADGKFKTWREVAVPFEEELRLFKHKVDSLTNAPVQLVALRKALTKGNIVLIDASRYITDSLAIPYNDTALKILAVAPELRGLEGIQKDYHQMISQETEIRFSCSAPVKVLVGFYNPVKAAFTKDSIFLKAPELETNASANDYGQGEIKIANAVVVAGMPPVNIHAYSFGAGDHVLKLGKGVCLILGFVAGNEMIPMYDAGLMEGGMRREVDWLFE
jgi:hypothetical protein